ncbi:hypothetical protein T484DRAFT_2019574, partial [Baffinella frigidus]
MATPARTPTRMPFAEVTGPNANHPAVLQFNAAPGKKGTLLFKPGQMIPKKILALRAMGGPPGSPQILRTNGNQRIVLAPSPVQAKAARVPSVFERSPVQGKTPADLRRAAKKQHAGPSPVPLNASWTIFGDPAAAAPTAGRMTPLKPLFDAMTLSPAQIHSARKGPLRAASFERSPPRFESPSGAASTPTQHKKDDLQDIVRDMSSVLLFAVADKPNPQDEAHLARARDLEAKRVVREKNRAKKEAALEQARAAAHQEAHRLAELDALILNTAAFEERGASLDDLAVRRTIDAKVVTICLALDAVRKLAASDAPSLAVGPEQLEAALKPRRGKAGGDAWLLQDLHDTLLRFAQNDVPEKGERKKGVGGASAAAWEERLKSWAASELGRHSPFGDLMEEDEEDGKRGSKAYSALSMDARLEVLDALVGCAMGAALEKEAAGEESLRPAPLGRDDNGRIYMHLPSGETGGVAGAGWVLRDAPPESKGRLSLA